MEMQDRRSFAGLLKFTLRTTSDDENDVKGVTHATSMQHLASGGSSTILWSNNSFRRRPNTGNSFLSGNSLFPPLLSR